MFRRQNSETAKRTCDPDVEVVDSIIGQSVVRAGLGLGQKQQDQRVLCLDGGGIKVKKLIVNGSQWNGILKELDYDNIKIGSWVSTGCHDYPLLLKNPTGSD